MKIVKINFIRDQTNMTYKIIYEVTYLYTVQGRRQLIFKIINNKIHIHESIK